MKIGLMQPKVILQESCFSDPGLVLYMRFVLRFYECAVPLERGKASLHVLDVGP